jgi:pimeloyl-ACP methyl ester carboxylesterase
MNAMNKRAVTLLLPLIAVAVFFMLNIGSRTAAQDPKKSAPNSGRQTIQTGYALVNGLKIYYEIHGTAKPRRPPLVLLHGGGDTIGTSFGRVLPALARDRQIIAFEQQGYGHTADIVERPFSFEQSADDTAALMEYLPIGQADLFGFSNGGTIALQVAIRHPRVVRKLVVHRGSLSATAAIRSSGTRWQTCS